MLVIMHIIKCTGIAKCCIDNYWWYSNWYSI